jgi:LmbE family N-acetylglucosaminyl deacetylase
VNNLTQGLLRHLSLSKRLRSLRRSVRGGLFDLPTRRCIPGAERVVVLAPHMDDEVLGCGGTLARHVHAGARVSVVFLTDGRYGGRLGNASQTLAQARKQEARRAGDILGVHRLYFLDAEDSRLDADPATVVGLRDVLLTENPSLVYLPFFLEGHEDHRAANTVMLSAVRGTQLNFECRAYEVATPLAPNCLIQIDETIELKKRALGCYQTQMAVKDYLHTCLGLNAYRSLAAAEDCRFVEAFHALPLADYRRLLLAVRHRSLCALRKRIFMTR